MSVGNAVPAGDRDEAVGWLLLVYRLPGEPTRLRSTAWRRLRVLGAVYLQHSVAALPAGAAAERALRTLRREIVQWGGTAVLLSCAAIVGGGGMHAAFQAARDEEYEEYEEIIEECRDFLDLLAQAHKAGHFTHAEMKRRERELAKLSGHVAAAAKRDVFGAPHSASALEALGTCGRALEAYAARVRTERGEGQQA